MIYSNTEFYYTDPDKISDDEITLEKDEAKHLVQVMRHSPGDKVNITDGIGNVYKCEILQTEKSSVKLKILHNNFLASKYPNIVFYLPVLKSSDRLEFALEKCVELGITNFVVYSSDKSYKRGLKLERLKKILLSAMKQSLQAKLPEISIIPSLKVKWREIQKTIILDQHANIHFSKFLDGKSNQLHVNLIIGPEGGFSDDETEIMNDSEKVYLTKNRLRTETAVISAASFLSILKY